MRFGFWPGPNNSWNDTLALARHAEAGGWHGVWYADHFMPNAEDTSGPTSECWTTLAALAASVPRIRLGALVTGNTYRHPAVLAKMAANVDNISGGRCVLGLGAGWQENEHRLRHQLPRSAGTPGRFEKPAVVTKGLLSNRKDDVRREALPADRCSLAPKPIQKPLPLLIGAAAIL